MTYRAQVNRLAMAMALVQPLLPAASSRVISMTTIRGKSEYPGHYPLPFEKSFPLPGIAQESAVQSGEGRSAMVCQLPVFVQEA